MQKLEPEGADQQLAAERLTNAVLQSRFWRLEWARALLAARDADMRRAPLSRAAEVTSSNLPIAIRTAERIVEAHRDGRKVRL